MANNEEQNIVDKAKDVAKAATEASKLAANLASGNLIGAAKNAFNLLKDKNFKKKLKRKIIKIVLISMIPIIIALSFFAVLDTIKDTMIELLSNAGTAISGFIAKSWQWMTDDYWIKLDEKIEYEVEGENGETTSESYTIVEKYIKELGNQGISLKELRLLGEGDYSNEEALLESEDNKELIEKYIAEFIRADIITQQPHKRWGSELVNPNNQNQIDGGVYFYRPIKQTSISDSELNSGLQSGQELDIEDKEYKQMTYLDSEEFIQKANNNDPNIKYNFSIDKDTGELLIAEIKTTSLIDEPLSTAEGDWFTDIEAWVNGYSLEASTTYEVTVKREDYKKYISKYTMPYEFLINLCEITQNPEFVYHVALLARDTKIILGVQDNTTVERETIEVETDYYDYINYKNNYTREATSSNKKLIKTRKVTTTTTETPVLTIQYADTWSFYEDKEYKKTTNVNTTQTNPNIEDIRKETLSGYNEPVYAYENHSVGSKVSEEAYQSFTDDAKIGFERVQEEPEYWYENNMASEERTATQMVTKTLTYNEVVGAGQSVEKSKQFLGLLRNTTGKCKYDCFPSGILGNVVNDVTQDYMPTAMFCSKHAEFDRNGTNVQYRIPNTTKTESPLNKLLSGLDMLYAVLQSNGSGYDENDKLLDEDSQDVLNVQDELLSSGNKKEQEGDIKGAEEDYESAYVVKMQGLVEHLQYLMTFPQEDSYTIKDIILEYLFGNDEDYDFSDVVVSPGVTASAAQIYDFLIEKGFTPESACAILGNIQQESSFNTAASNGTHFGLCQWGDGRYEGLLSFAESRGTEWTDLETQLEYLWSELNGSKANVKNAIINSTDMEYATDVFCRKFEICGNYGVEVPKRYRYAQFWYNIFVSGNNSNLTPTQNALLEVINNLSAYSGIQNQGGYCQRFVKTVLNQIGVYGNASSASNAEQQWKVSSDMSNIPVGAAVYGKGSGPDGHVGIYIGNGMVVHNTGNPNCSYAGMRGIKCEDINSWDRKYTFTSWGWQGGVDLSV